MSWPQNFDIGGHKSQQFSAAAIEQHKIHKVLGVSAVPIAGHGRAVETQSKGPSQAIKYIIRL